MSFNEGKMSFKSFLILRIVRGMSAIYRSSKQLSTTVFGINVY